jgi:hypothetical protein
MKHYLTEAKARQIVQCKKALGEGAVGWIERWITQLVQERSLPPQLASKDFAGKIFEVFAPREALEILDRVRADFRVAWGHLFEPEKDLELEQE